MSTDEAPTNEQANALPNITGDSSESETFRITSKHYKRLMVTEVPYDFVAEAVDERPEFTWNSTREEAIERIFDSIEELDRVEIYVRNDVGAIVAGCVCVHHASDHVGDCLAIKWLFLTAGARGGIHVRKMLGLAKALARDNGLNIMLLPSRVAVGEYRYKYRRV